MMMEALAARLREPPFGELSVECVDLRFSPPAAHDLMRELHAAGYAIWHADKTGPFPAVANGPKLGCIAREMTDKGILMAESKKSDRYFLFSVDQNLPGKSFVVSLKK